MAVLMITVDYLIECGAMSGNYKLVNMQGLKLTTISQVQGMSIEGQSDFEGVVVCDNPVWIATYGAMPAEQAETVFSYNGSRLGKWRRQERTFRTLELVEDTLVLKSQFKLERKTNTMAKTPELQNPINLQTLDIKQQVGNLNAFTADAKTQAPAADQTPEEAEKARKALERQMAHEAETKKINAIRENGQNATMADNSAVVDFNRRNGRFMGFITTNDETIKISAKKKAKVDENGKAIVNSTFKDAPPAIREAYSEGKKNPPLKYCECEYDVAAKDVKPSGIKAAVIRLPKTGDFRVAQLAQNGVIEFDSHDTTLITKLLRKEDAINFIHTHFDGKIKEDEATVGATATDITATVSKVEVESANGSGIPDLKLVSKFGFVKTEGRTSLIVRGNYFPIKVYETIATQDLTEEAAKSLNLNVAAAMSKISVTDLSASSQEMVKETEGVYTCDWFKTKDAAPIVVSRFDNAAENVAQVRVPVRTAELASSGSKTVFKFAYNDYSTEQGPFSKPEFQKVFESFKVSKEDFVEFLDSLKTRSTSGSKGNSLNSKDYLRNMIYNTKGYYEGASITDLSESVAKFTFE